MPGPISANALCIDRALEYERAVKTKSTLDVLLNIDKCCNNYCSANLSRLDVAHFRASLVDHVHVKLTNTEVRRAIRAEIRKRAHARNDGCFDVETHVGHVDYVCLPHFYRILGVGYKAIRSIFQNAHDPTIDDHHCYYGNDANLRAIARISNKIREYGEFHPADAAIMVPPSEKRSHFLRTGKKGESVVSRRMVKAYFGAPVRVHKASSFMKCACCIALKLYAEERSGALKRVTSLINDAEYAKSNRRKGEYLREAALKLAEDRAECQKFVDIRKSILEQRNENKQGLMEEDIELEEYVDAMEVEEEQANDNNDENDEAVANNNAEVEESGGSLSTLEKEMRDLDNAFIQGEIDVMEYLNGLKVKIQGLTSLHNAMRKFHYRCIRMERMLVYSAQEAAATCPDEICTLIVDGCGKERTKASPHFFHKKKIETIVVQLPFYPDRMKDIAPDSRQLKNPVCGIQESLPVAVANATEAAQHVGASDFELRTTDFIIALEWTTVGGADLYASILLDFLYQKTVVPRIMVLVLDNAPVNKGEPIMTWLAFIMLRTHIDEVHVYFPSTGHTHTTLDAHFGKAKPKDPKKCVLTPQDLKNHLESLPKTRAVLNFALYRMADKLSDYAHTYSGRMEQHHFVLFKDKSQNVMFKYSPLLRFAEHMTARIRSLLETHSYFMYMSDEEREDGIPVFRLDDGATYEALDEIAAQCKAAPWVIPPEKIRALAKEIPPIYFAGREEAAAKEFAAITNIAKPEHDLSLSEMLEAIKAKERPRNNGVAEEDPSHVLAELMQQVKFQKREKMSGALSIPKGGADASKVRNATTRRVLSMLKAVHPDIESDFVGAASVASKNGKVAQGYKAIVEEIASRIGNPSANPRKRTAGQLSSAISSGATSRGSSMPPPPLPAQATRSTTSSPRKKKRPRAKPMIDYTMEGGEEEEVEVEGRGGEVGEGRRGGGRRRGGGGGEGEEDMMMDPDFDGGNEEEEDVPSTSSAQSIASIASRAGSRTKDKPKPVYKADP